MLAFCRSSPLGHGIVRMILCVCRSVLHDRRRADLEAIHELGGGRRDQHDEAILRIRFEAADPDLAVAFAQRERIQGLPRGDVQDLDFLHRRFDRVEPLPILGQGRPARNPGLERNRSDDLLGRFVDDPELLRVGADDQGAVASRRPRFVGGVDRQRGAEHEKGGEDGRAIHLRLCSTAPGRVSTAHSIDHGRKAARSL